MDKGPEFSPEIGQAIATAFMGLWAFLGGIMRSGADWRDPKSGRFSFPMFITSMATAAVLGQVASWWGTSHHWEAGAIGVTADALIITSDNPRNEVPAEIIAQIVAGTVRIRAAMPCR